MLASDSDLVNLLIITSNTKVLDKSLGYLKRHKYDIKICANMTEVSGIVQKWIPDVIMLNWGQKNMNMVKTYRYFTEKMGLLCLVYTEDSSPRVTSALVRSRIPNTLFPPLSGTGVHRRIQSLVMRKKNRLKAKTPATPKAHVSKKYGAIRIMAEEVGATTTWEEVEAIIPKTENSDTA